MNNKVIYIIFHSPSLNILSKGTVLKENMNKIYIQYQDKTYAYIKDEKDRGKILGFKDNNNVLLFRKNGDWFMTEEYKVTITQTKKTSFIFRADSEEDLNKKVETCIQEKAMGFDKEKPEYSVEVRKMEIET